MNLKMYYDQPVAIGGIGGSGTRLVAEFLELIKSLELIEFHKSWFQLLQENGIRYTIINSQKGNFTKVHSIELAIVLIPK